MITRALTGSSRRRAEYWRVTGLDHVSSPLNRVVVAMASESIQQRLSRIRRRPIRPIYEVKVGGASVKCELPFVVGVLADLTGTPAEPPRALRGREFVAITRCDFDHVLAGMTPGLAFQVGNTLDDEGSPLSVELRFRSLSDFEPGSVAQQVEPLRDLLAARDSLANLLKAGNDSDLDRLLEKLILSDLDVEPATPGASDLPAVGAPNIEVRLKPGPGPQTSPEPSLLDLIIASTPPAPTNAEELRQRRERADTFGLRTFDDSSSRLDARGLDDLCTAHIARIDEVLSRQLSLILHHPEFRRLEASWRGLSYLVRSSETGRTLKIKVLNARKDDLLREAERAVAFDQTTLFKKVFSDVFGTYGAEPFGVLIGDYEFGHGDDDQTLLTTLSQIAATAHAPFLAAASPGLFDRGGFLDLTETPERVDYLRADGHPRWRAFRESEESRYVGLCLPRILLRLPYGPDHRPCREFNFVEDLAGADRSGFLWGNPAYALAARLTDAFSRTGWCIAARGVECGGLVCDLPRATGANAPGDEPVGPTEMTISDRREEELSRHGLITLVPIRDTRDAAFFNLRSCHEVRGERDGLPSSRDHLPSLLPYTLLASRFAHYLMAMLRDRIEPFMMAPEECAREFNGWIAHYVHPDDRWYPLREARIEVVHQSPWGAGYQAVVHLRPHGDVGESTAWLRTVVEVPPQASQ